MFTCSSNEFKRKFYSEDCDHPNSFWQLMQYNRCQGTQSVYQSNISKHKLELKQTQYKDIEKRYFNQLLQLKVDGMNVQVHFLWFLILLLDLIADVTADN